MGSGGPVPNKPLEALVSQSLRGVQPHCEVVRLTYLLSGDLRLELCLSPRVRPHPCPLCARRLAVENSKSLFLGDLLLFGNRN